MGLNKERKLQVRKFREAAGLTQDQLAAATGIPQSTISYLEVRAGNSGIATLQKLADFFEVRIEELYERAETNGQTA